MRTLFTLLLLGVATPALASQPAEEPDGAEQQVREERSQRFERPQRGVRSEPGAEQPRRERMFERVIRAERQERAERPERAAPPELAAAPEPVERQERRERWSAPARVSDGERPRRPSQPVSEAETGRVGDSVREWRWRERAAERERRRSSELPTPPVGERLARPDGAVPPVAVAPPGRSDGRMGNALRNRIATEGWRREWREDRRFDWRRHRYGYRDRFDVGLYVDPFGWNYRRWNIGWRMPRHHYARHFWIHDPWHYRLPPVYGPYRWVRYWDDALLIDLRTGRVVDVIRDFFW